MYEYRVLEFHNLEPMKIGSGGNKSTYTEPSRDFLPGSTIRGALISQFVNSRLFDEYKQNILYELECYNAYPYAESTKTLFLPTPIHLRMDKHEWRENTKNNQITAIANLAADNSDSRCKNQLRPSFVSEVIVQTQDEPQSVLRGLLVQKEFRLHHTTAFDEVEPENLFRYEAISSGQVFRSILKYRIELRPHFDNIFGSNNTLTVYIGGSKGSGYGKCEVYNKGTYAEYSEAINRLGLQFKKSKNNLEEMTVTCLSDCMFRDVYGQPTNYLPEEYIYQLTGLRVSIAKKFVQTGVTEGYNTKWNARYPKETTVKAGSVLIYKLPSKISEDEKNSLEKLLEQNLIGYRTQDGYGWVGINFDYPNKILPNEAECITQCAINAAVTDSDFKTIEDRHTMDTILTGLKDAKKRWLQMIYIKSLNHQDEATSDYRFIINNVMKNSQISNLIEKLNQFKDGKLVDTDTLKYYYANNNKMFSLAGCNFKTICEYLNGKEENSRLDDLINKKLNSKLGQLFYNDTEKKLRDIKFLIEFLLVGLEIERRRRNSGK